jgi:hypothetical protein
VVADTCSQFWRLSSAGRPGYHGGSPLPGTSGSMVEFVQDDATGCHYHFGSEVLHADPTRAFPWRLRTDWEWAALRELDDFWATGQH